MSIDAVSASVRALSFIALFQGAGMTIFLALFGPQLLHAARRITSVAIASSVVGVLSVCLHYALEAARMAGEFAGVFDADLQRLALHSNVSAVAALRVLGLALAITAVASAGKYRRMLAFGAACLIVVSFALVGHTAQDQHGWWLRVLLLIHVMVVMFWFGSLLPLMLVSRLEVPASAAAIVERFSQFAMRAVPAIFVAGLAIMSVLLDSWSQLLQPYGLILLGKISAFAALMGLAAINRWRLGPTLATRPGAAIAFHRSVLLEYGLIVGVLVATVFLTTFFSPDSASSL